MTKYPLKDLLILKEKKCDEAEKTLKEKKEALKKEEATLKTFEEKRDEIAEHRTLKLDQIREKMDAGEAPHKLVQMRHYLKTVDEKLAAQEHKVKEQRKVRDVLAQYKKK